MSLLIARIARISRIVRIAVALVLVLGGCVSQRPDPEAPIAVDDPALAGRTPLVLVDEGHENFHTAGGRYKPFVDLVSSDGCRVRPLSAAITPETLRGADILVIANAMAPLAEREIGALVEWIEGGGGLLLVTDHPPAAAPAQPLARALGVDLSGRWTADPGRVDREGLSPTWIRYDRAADALATHPILDGRGPAERVDVVVTFTGQSLAGDSGVMLLAMSEDAIEYDSRESARAERDARAVPGRGQAIALEIGRGRVVITAEAAMLTAQIARRPGKEVRIGFNRPGIDNRQFALNIMRWLAGAL